MTTRILLAFGIVYVVCLFGLPLVFGGSLNEDEGWYPYVGSLLYEGNNLYKDVLFTQAPISAGVYGFVYHFINSSILTGRLTAFLIYIVAALVVYFALARLFNPRAALAGALIAILCPISMTGINAPITYPIVNLFIALSMLVYSYEFNYKYVLVGMLVGLACMTRLPAILVLLFFIFLHRDKVLPLSIGCLIGVLPFSYIFLQSPQATAFSLFTYHTTWYAAGAGYWTALKFNYIVAMTVALLPTLLLCALNNFKYGRAGLATIGIVAAVQWLPLQTLSIYNAFMFPIIGYVAVENITHLKLERLVLIPLLITTILTTGTYYHAYQPQQLRDTRNMAQYLQEITEPGEQVFTYHTYIAVEADLTVDRRQAMGVFSYWLEGTISDKDALQFNVITADIEEQMLNRSPRVLILDDYEAARIDLSDYEVVRHYDSFGQFQRPFDIWLHKEGINND